jgi:putative transposase
MIRQYTFVEENKRIHHNNHNAILGKHHYTKPESILCKWCGSNDIKKYGMRKDLQEYICLKCGHKFNTRDTPYMKQFTFEQIGTSISLYFNGLSFADIARHLTESGTPIRDSTVYRWVMSYSQKPIAIFDRYKPNVSATWIVDKTTIKFNAVNYWLWDIIDRDTRFLLASYILPKEAKMLMELAAKRAGKIPDQVITDRLISNINDGESLSSTGTLNTPSSLSYKMDETNIIESIQNTLKDRTKIVKGIKRITTARVILDGFLIHYNFFSPHVSINGKTPAELAGLNIPFKTWTEFVRANNKWFFVKEMMGLK